MSFRGSKKGLYCKRKNKQKQKRQAKSDNTTPCGGHAQQLRKVVYQEFNEYHLILRGLFKNFKTPTIINKLLLSHVYYCGGFKILK